TYQLDSIRYIPVDFSQPAMEESAMLLMDKYPGINIYGMVADFTSQLELIPDNEKRFICFLGSTLGNLNKTETQRFLTNIRLSMQPDDTFILGIDMVKSKEILEKAYNDNQRITEKFNRNILNVVNDLTSTNFKPGEFEHAAFFNEKESRIEMHLKAMNDMKISSALFPDTIKIKKGEMIHTENSQKYSSEMLRDLLFTTGFKIDRTYTDANKWFSLLQLSTK
ncbi:MAG: L-histidine N(alpha)-methyltransferase, partial [Calditrichaceae bacterium]